MKKIMIILPFLVSCNYGTPLVKETEEKIKEISLIIKTQEIDLEESQQVVDFGKIKSSKRINLILKNSTESTVSISPEIVGTDASNFSVVQSQCPPALESKKACKIQLLFEARKSFNGNKQALLNIVNEFSLIGQIDGNGEDPEITGEASLEITGGKLDSANPVVNYVIKNEGSGTAKNILSFLRNSSAIIRLNH